MSTEEPLAGWRASRLGPLGVVALVSSFDLWVLRAQRVPTPNLNDGSVHAAMARWAEQRISSGHLPLDGWFPYLQLGSSQFHHYQSFPHIVTGLLGVPFGTDRVFYWVLYLLLALFPVSVYLGARMMGWGRWPAALAAVVSPLLVSKPSLGYEWASYTWQGSGVWAQLWGMWFLPLAVGSASRAIQGRGSLALAAVFVSFTVVSHFQTGYLALLMVVAFTFVSLKGLRGRLVRGAAVFGGALLLSAWLLVPLVTDERWSPVNEFTAGTFYADSFGARKVLGWLFSGQIFDSGRFPVVSLLVAVGALVCLVRWRRDERARSVLALFVVSLLLFFGRPTLGAMLNLLPGTKDMFLRRYVFGVHLAGILMAGVGLAWMGRVALGAGRRFVPRVRPAAAVAVLVAALVGILAPAWVERADYEALGASWMAQQRQADATDGAALQVLVRRAQELGGGRIYAGLRSNWGADYKIAFVPVYAWLLDHDADAVGFTLRTKSLSADVEPYFAESDPSDYPLFGIRYLILPADRTPPVVATLIERRGRHTLWRVATTGFVRVVDTVGPPIVADRTNLGARAASFLRSTDLAEGLYPTVAFGGATAARPTASSRHPPSGPAGRVLHEVDALPDGFATATLQADRPSVALLAASFDPRWTARVDGRTVQTQMVAPSLVGAPVTPGRHTIAFVYRPYPLYWVLLAIGAAALAGLIMVPRARRRRVATHRREG
ncbi:MAG: hypothetical protein M3Q23_09360 [Actinomycetota bacterium]|nr:hypothetical protein [Actinomycetota bacterium]